MIPPGADGRFQVLRLLDQGGMGIVYVVRDHEVNREVALKQLNEADATDAQKRARFVLEAEIAGNLEHPGIVPVYGVGQDAEGRPYYAMRYVKGESFKEAVDHFHQDPVLVGDAAARRREFQNLLRRFLTVCETMEYAHNRGVLHRDLKPRNILLGPYGETLVIDWGLTKVVGRGDSEPPSDATLRPPSSSEIDPTLAGTTLGTLAFMSPEQVRGEVAGLGPATDIYGLGATLYYLLTGRPPFEGSERTELIRKVQRGEYRAPREVKSTVDPALDAVCRKAMALLPEERYMSARALAEDLERWLADQAVGAYPEPIGSRTARWVRRHRQLAGSLGALVVLALLGVGYHDWTVSGAEIKARSHLRITLGAVRDLLNLCGVNLAFVPNTERLRQEVASRGLSLCYELAQNFPSDQGVQLQTSQVYRVIAGIDRMTGRFEFSRRASDRAIQILSQLSNANPEDSELRYWLVEALIDRGALLSLQGKSAESERDLVLAIAEAEKLRTRAAEEQYPRGKGMALINLSEIYLARDQTGLALEAAGNAVNLLGPLAEPATPSPRTRHRSMATDTRTDRPGQRSASQGRKRSGPGRP